MSKKILIVGSGAIGSFYGGLLQQQGNDVSVVIRSYLEEIRNNGIAIKSTLGEWTFRPSQVVQHASEYEGHADYVILCVKVTEDNDQVALIRDAVGPGTVIVLIQNGVEIEAPFATAFPDNQLLSALAFICANRTAPREVTHLAYGRLALGCYPRGTSPEAEYLCRQLQDAGVEAQCSEDIVSQRWLKCIWNAAFNPLSVLSGGLETSAILACQEAFIRALMAEVHGVARALGHELPANCVERNIDSTERMPPYKTSMLLDYEAGRPMETEAILGNTLRAAQRAGVFTPHLNSVYALMKLRETQLAQQRKDTAQES